MVKAEFGFFDFEQFEEIQKYYEVEIVLQKLDSNFYEKSGVLLCCQSVEISWILSNRISDLEEG